MVTILMMSAKMANPGLLKIKFFWKKGYGVIISVHDITNKILSRDLNYNVNVIMRPKFGNCDRSYYNLNFIRIWPEKPSKGSKLKARNFWGLIPTFAKVTKEKLVKNWAKSPPPPTFILNMVNISKKILSEVSEYFFIDLNENS